MSAAIVDPVCVLFTVLSKIQKVANNNISK